MSQDRKLTNITDYQLKQSGVQALADRPNAAQQYGQSGLSATQLKLWFDKLATLLASKLNLLQDTIQSSEGAEYIGIALSEYKTLDALIEAMQNGEFADKILKLQENPTVNRATLQEIIYSISEKIADINEALDSLENTKLSKVETAESLRRAYGVGKDGTQIMLPVSEVPTSNAIAAYNEEGILKASMTPLPGYETMAYPSEVVNMAFINELRKHIGAGVRFSMDPQTYIVTFEVLDINGNVLSSGSLDLPLENVVIGCTYNETTHKIEITLQNGTKTEIPVADLVNGLVTEAQHKADKKELNDKIDAMFTAYIVDVYNLVGGDYVDYS